VEDEPNSVELLLPNMVVHLDHTHADQDQEVDKRSHHQVKKEEDRATENKPEAEAHDASNYS
jgi:hypothetical protein